LSPKQAITRPVGRKKTLKPKLKQQYVISPDVTAAFVAAIEDVIEVYHKPRNSDRPVGCVDEPLKQLIVGSQQTVFDRESPSLGGRSESEQCQSRLAIRPGGRPD
jgi:hypothetical protein